MAVPKGSTIQSTDITAAQKKRLYFSVPIILGGGDSSFVQVRGDVADYYNVPVEATEAGMKEVVRNSDTGMISRYGGGILDTSPVEVPVDRTQRYYMPPKASAKSGGRIVRLNTELKSPKGTIRTVVMRFPRKAILAVISDWLFNNLKVKSPGKFSTGTGTTYLIVSKGAITDLNPRSSTAPLPPPTGT